MFHLEQEGGQCFTNISCYYFNWNASPEHLPEDPGLLLLAVTDHLFLSVLSIIAITSLLLPQPAKVKEIIFLPLSVSICLPVCNQAIS